MTSISPGGTPRPCTARRRASPRYKRRDDGRRLGTNGETTGVASVQTESRGPVDDAYIRFADRADRYEQYKERLGDQRERDEILEDFRDRHVQSPDAIIAIVTRDTWEDLRELVQYAVSDDRTLTSFKDMLDANANKRVQTLFASVCDNLFAGDEAHAVTFLRHLDVQDSGPDIDRIAQDTTAHYLQRVVKPAVGAFDLLVRLAQTTGKTGTPRSEEDIRAYLTVRRRRVFSLRSTDRIFLTPGEYRRRVERDVPLGYAGRTVGRDAILDDVFDRVARDEAAVAISAAPGLGKTRLCLDLAARLADDERTRELTVLFVRPYARPSDADLEQLDPGKRYLIVLDNAHEVEAILTLLREALGNGDLASSVQVIATIHPSYAKEIKRALATAARAVVEIPLTPIGAQDLDALLGQAPYSVANDRLRDQIVRLADGNPLLAQFAVEVARNGGDLSALHTRDIPGQYLERFTAQVGWSDAEVMHRYLAILAALRRIEAQWPQLRERIRAVAGLDAAQEERLLGLLQRAGVVRRNVRSIRLKPDLLRDYVLDAAFFAPDHRYNFVDMVVREFIPLKLDDIMCSAAEAEGRTTAQAATEALDELFAAIEQVVQGAGNATRLRLIEMVREAAFYRPDDALGVILPIVEGPEGSDEQVPDPLFGQAWTPTHAHVLRAIVETLGQTRYHRLGDSLDVLFALATYRPNDARYDEVRSRALTMLEETSTYDPYAKLYVVQATVVEHLKEWIVEPNGRAIGLRLLPHLLTTGFTSSRVSPTRPMEARIISGALPHTPTLVGIYRDALITAETLYDTSADVAERTAIIKVFDRLIEQLWHASVTPELRRAVTDVCNSLVETFERWAIDPSVPLPAFEEMYEWAHRARTLGVLPESKLDVLLHLPQANGTFEVYLQLMGFPMRYRRDKTFKEIEQEQEAWLQQTGGQITPVTLDAWLEMLHRIIDEYGRSHDHLLIGRIQPLLEIATARDSTVGRAIVDRLAVGDDNLRPMLVVPLVALRKVSPNAFQSYADQWLADGRSEFSRHVAQALALTMPWGVIRSYDHDLACALVDIDDLAIDLAIIACLPAVGEQDGTEAVELAKRIAGRGDQRALGALTAVLPTPHTQQYAGTQVIRNIPVDDYLTLVRALEELDQLDYHVEWCLEHVADIAPDAVIDFFESRIQRANSAGPTFDPIPHTLADGHLVERLQDGGHYADLLRRVRDLTLQGSQMERWRASSLFHSLSPRRDRAGGMDDAMIDDTIVAILREWIIPPDRERLIAVARLLREYAVTDVYLQLARDTIAAARGDKEVEAEVMVALGTTGVQWGPLSDTFKQRADMVRQWEQDGNLYVRRFAGKLKKALLRHADQSDAATEDLLEENL